ncbi:MAG: hypothetical protein Q9170_001775 [Blastenia crenularia]
MDRLPAELILNIAYYLDAFDVVKLHLVSKRLHQTTRDTEFWKQLCFEDSTSAAIQKRRDLQFIAPSAIRESARVFEFQRRARALSTTSGLEAAKRDGKKNSRPFNRSRAVANWDPSYTSEKIDWYEEYIARHAPISLSWLQQPTHERDQNNREIRGLSRYDRGVDSLIIAPLDDGSVSVWNIGGQDESVQTQTGTVVAHSKPHLLSTYPYGPSGSALALPPTQLGPNIVECISVDQVRNKAYVAVLNELNEVDLETLQISSRAQYPFLISALSDTTYPVLLTVATANSLHLHDPREASNAPLAGSDQVESIECNTAALPPSPHSQSDFYRMLTAGVNARYAPLSQPGSLSITHLPPASGQHDGLGGYICVAGRYPSILSYNRRMFPRLDSTIHSGSRLATMTSLPHPLLYSRSNPPSDPHAAHTLIACGEYKGKGSLELYPCSTSGQPNPPIHSPTPLAPVIPYQNRTSASRSKILSVTPHGTRIVFSDGDGGLKWVERDGQSLVRRWNINAYTASESTLLFDPNSPQRVSNLFSSSTHDGGNVLRKILPVGPWENSKGELAVWTGEKIGILGFRPKPRFEFESMQEEKDSLEESLYAGRMRRALERQANEVRFVRGLGLDR